MAGHSSTEHDPVLTLTTQQPVAQQRIVDLLQAAWAVFVKDLRIELRTRYAINAMVLFAACTAMMVSIGTTFIGLRRTEEALLIQASLLWIALLFAAISGLSRGFVHEEETRTLAALRLAAPAIAV
ncbi:MAG: heme ABC transporter permease CcmB, partial [Chloroflexia bacterium]|nr:heme ABC transporter permease CcmB [Chloroflexia bacterium]